MAARRRGHADRVARQAMELGWAAPQVMAHRLARMALAGPRLDARDRREFTGMVLEKPAVFGQGLVAAWLELARMQWTFAASLWTPWLAVTGAALAPVHRKATANARRLARTRLTAR